MVKSYAVIFLPENTGSRWGDQPTYMSSYRIQGFKEGPFTGIVLPDQNIEFRQFYRIVASFDASKLSNIDF